MEYNELGTAALLIGLELILGIDNILVISILTGRLPAEKRLWARNVGLAIALGARLLMLLGVSELQKLSTPIIASLSGRDLVLLGGGIFLMYKAVKEIHHVVERSHSDELASGKGASVASIITQIVLLDIVFSVDSVITAVGLTDNLTTIYAAVIISFVAVLFFAGPIGDFVTKHPTLKILALSFLITISITLCLEAFHHEIPKAYIYLPMGFALFVELLQMRYDYNNKKG